jgi:hypothetical protein
MESNKDAINANQQRSSNKINHFIQGCQFCSVSPGMAETFHTNSKNRTK